MRRKRFSHRPQQVTLDHFVIALVLWQETIRSTSKTCHVIFKQFVVAARLGLLGLSPPFYESPSIASLTQNLVQVGSSVKRSILRMPMALPRTWGSAS